jgi:hypothetical protein
MKWTLKFADLCNVQLEMSSNNRHAVHKTHRTAPHDHRPHNQAAPHEVTKQS